MLMIRDNMMKDDASVTVQKTKVWSCLEVLMEKVRNLIKFKSLLVNKNPP